MACKCRTIFKVIYLSVIVLALVSLAAGPLIVSAARKAASSALNNAQVDIKSCRLWPPGSCVLSGIEIRREAAYRISIDKITVRIRPSLHFSSVIFEVHLKGARISLDVPGARLADLQAYVSIRKSKGPVFLPGNIIAEDLVLDVNTKDLMLDAQGSFSLALRPAELKSISLNVRQLEYSGIRVSSASLQAAAQRPGSFFMEKLDAGKLAVRNARAGVSIAGMDLKLEDLTAEALAGSIHAIARFTLAAGLPYEASVKAVNLDLAVFVRDFDLQERLDLSGLVTGALEARGSSSGFKILTGDLKGIEPGGFLNIRDQSMIDTLAARSGQARDLIGRSFTDYRYDNAQAQLYSEENKLVLDVAFLGIQGKRSLKVVLHDFTVKGGGK